MPPFRGYPYPRRALQVSCLALCLIVPAVPAYAEHTASPTDLAVANRIAFARAWSPRSTITGWTPG